MAGDADTIKDFLVGLGFKVDAAGLKTFMGTLEGVTRAAIAVGVGVTAAATATVTAVATISEKFEDLYYAAQRTHSTIGNIQGMGFAIGQLGGTSEASLSSLENLGSFLRSNPGGEKFIQSIGVATRDANGELRDNVKIMDDLGKRYKTMPFYRAKVYAGLLGTDEKTLIAMMKDTDKFKQQLTDAYKAAGVNQEEAGQKSVEFMNRLRLLRVQGEALGAMFSGRLAPAAGFFLKVVDGLIWAVEKMDQLTGGLTTDIIAAAAAMGIASKAAKLLGLDLIALIGKGLAPLLMRLGVLIVDVLPALGEAVFAVGEAIAAGGAIAFGWIALIIGAVIALGYAAYKIYEHWGDIGPFFGRLWDDVAGFFKSAVAWIARFVGQMAPDALKAAWGGIVPFFADLWDGIENIFKGGWGRIKPYVEAMARIVKRDWAGALGALTGGTIGFVMAGPPGAVGGAVAGGAIGHAANTPEGQKALKDAGRVAMDFFKQAGWTAAQAAGIVANIGRESGFKAGAVGDGGRAFGLGQWHPDRQRAFAQFAGHDIKQSTFEEQLAFINYELTKGGEKMAGSILKGTKDAFSAGAVVSTRYERPGDVEGEANKRGALAEKYFADANLGAGNGGKNITVHQTNKNEFHINESQSPSETAKAIGGQQDRVHGDAVRNLKGALS